VLDELDRKLLEILVKDSRTSLKELAAQVGLSSPSVSERLRRLEERGVIRAFTIEIDPQALGFTLQAIVRIRPLPGKLHIVQKLIEEIPEFGECDKLTPFIGANKAVFEVEYTLSTSAFCSQANAMNFNSLKKIGTSLPP